jgi:hypothetical protein
MNEIDLQVISMHAASYMMDVMVLVSLANM